MDEDGTFTGQGGTEPLCLRYFGSRKTLKRPDLLRPLLACIIHDPVWLKDPLLEPLKKTLLKMEAQVSDAIKSSGYLPCAAIWSEELRSKIDFGAFQELSDFLESLYEIEEVDWPPFPRASPTPIWNSRYKDLERFPEVKNFLETFACIDPCFTPDDRRLAHIVAYYNYLYLELTGDLAFTIPTLIDKPGSEPYKYNYLYENVATFRPFHLVRALAGARVITFFLGMGPVGRGWIELPSESKEIPAVLEKLDELLYGLIKGTNLEIESEEDEEDEKEENTDESGIKEEIN